MTRWLPYPGMSAALLATWLLLNQPVGAGSLVLGAALALGVPFVLKALDVKRTRARRLGAAARLSARVLADVVRSNVAVAKIILSPRPLALRSGFVTVPLALRSTAALSTLACIITATPGTIWVNFDRANGLLTIHVLDLVDESVWIGTIKGRYERRLLEIFE